MNLKEGEDVPEPTLFISLAQVLRDEEELFAIGETM